MAGLKKPVRCECGSTDFHREYGPERWVCDKCDTIVRTRQKRPDNNSCRDCGASRSEKPFKKGKNQCLDCYNEYMKDWRTDNPVYRAYRRDVAVKQRLKGNVRRAIERSPQSFIRYLLCSTKRAARNKAGKTGFKQVIGIVEIDFDLLWNTYQEQGGKCAVSNLPLLHEMGDLCTMSIDRIDSDSGYVPGNVHLVCQWVNHARRHHDLGEFRAVLDAYLSVAGLGAIDP